jgi:hypothetical protein
VGAAGVLLLILGLNLRRPSGVAPIAAFFSSRLISVFTVAKVQPCGAATSAVISSAERGLCRHNASITTLSAELIFIVYACIRWDEYIRKRWSQRRLRDAERL